MKTKKTLQFLIIYLAPFISCAQIIQTITSKDGRSITAEIISIENDSVRIIRTDKTQFTLPFSAIIDTDVELLKKLHVPHSHSDINIMKDMSAQIIKLQSTYGSRYFIEVVSKLKTPIEFKGMEAYEVIIKHTAKYIKRNLDTGQELPTHHAPQTAAGILEIYDISNISYIYKVVNPTPIPTTINRRAILLTTQTSFKSQGGAVILAKEEPSIELEDINGFPMKIPVIREQASDPAVENTIVDLFDNILPVMKRVSSLLKKKIAKPKASANGVGP